MSSESVRNSCPPTCPTVKKQIRAAIAEAPWLLNGIFPRKRNDVETRPPPDIISKDMRDKSKRVIETDVYRAPVVGDEKVEVDVPSEALEGIVTAKLIQEQVVEETRVIQEPTIIQESIIIPSEKLADRDEKKIDLVEERELVQEATIIQEPIVIPIEEIADRNGKKIVQETTVIPAEKIADRDDKKIDLIEEKEVPVAIEKLEIVENEIDRVVLTEIAPSLEAEEYFEPEKLHVEPDDEEAEITTDYEKFIDEELQEALPAVIAKEIPDELRPVRREISKDAAVVYERIDRRRPEREVIPEEPPAGEEVAVRRVVANSARAKPIVSREAAEEACDETCPLVMEQKERIIRKLKERQRIVDDYYLTKGFSYFEDVCTCSLACMMYTLSRDPFVRSIFASLALFAVGLKLCSELDAWEMPSRVS